MILEILAYSVLIMFASLIGVFSIWKRLGSLIQNNLVFFVSFSAGVFSVVAFHLTEEVLHHSTSVPVGLAWILFGFLAIFIFFKILPGFHHHHSKKEEDHGHDVLDARKIMFSDGVHNIGDGIFLAASFSVSLSLGAVTALSVFIHELIQETSEFFVLREAGLSTKKALIINFLISSTILIGSIGGYFLLDSFESLESPLLGIAAGSFLTVVIHDLIPHSVRTSSKRTHYVKHGIWFVVGVIVMTSISLLTAGH